MSQPPTSSAAIDHASRHQAAMQQTQRNNAYGVSLPSLRHMSSTPPTPVSERRPGSLLGVHSILNPQPESADSSHNLPPISRPSSVDSTQGEMVQGRPFQTPGRPRHLLTSRSPVVHRAQSLSVLAAPTGTIDAHASPFLSASLRPMGTVPRPTAPTPPPGMARDDLRRQSVGFPQSGSASPSPNFSPYSQPASVASSQYEGHGHTPYPPPTNNPPMQDSSNQHSIAMEGERRGMPMGPTSQSSIQIMTIKSQQGHHVQIPVEVQAASKVADEKRKRNAGASARFRARRKEKEREASHSISRLETQLREALEDIEYYRGERDYFKTVVFQQPGAERHYARPPSPRLRRVSLPPSIAPSSTTGGGSQGSPYSAYDDDPPESDRNVRRRTSNYHPPPGQAPTTMNGSGPQSTGTYPTPAFASVNGPSPASNRPQSFDPRDQRPLPQMQQQQSPPHPQRPVLRDPFAPTDSGRYEARNWAPGPGRAQPHDQRG